MPDAELACSPGSFSTPEEVALPWILSSASLYCCMGKTEQSVSICLEISKVFLYQPQGTLGET